MAHEERLAAARKLSTRELLQLRCPSAEFNKNLHSLGERIATAKKATEAAEKKLLLVQQNRVAVELAGRDHQAEVRSTRLDLLHIQREQHSLKEEMRQLFVAEREIFDLKRNAMFKAVYEHFIQRAETRLKKLFTEMLDTLREMAASSTLLLQDDDSGSSEVRETLKAIDNDGAQLARAAKQNGVSLQPYNSMTPVTESVQASMRNVVKLLPRSEFNQILKSLEMPELLTTGEASSRSLVSERAAIQMAEKTFLENMQPSNFYIPERE